MNEPHVNPTAWQPVTPRGVAAFARAGTGRLWLVQSLVALIAAGVTVWFFDRAWIPTIEAALERLPETGEIRNGQLLWPGDSPVRLAEGAFLALSVDPEHTGPLRSPADLEVEFGRASVIFRSLFGEAEVAYPPRDAFPFNRIELQARWGAWKPAVLAGVGAVTFLALWLCWQALAALYALPAWIIAFYADRELTLIGSWRLAGAALLPGALWLALATALYGAGVLDLLRWLLAFGAHLVIGWGYVVAGARAAPRSPEAAARKNPFAAGGPR